MGWGQTMGAPSKKIYASTGVVYSASDPMQATTDPSLYRFLMLHRQVWPSLLWGPAPFPGSWCTFCLYPARVCFPKNLKDSYVSTKRCTTWELQVKFCWGWNKDCNPVGSTSLRNCSKEVVGEDQYKIWVKGDFSAIKHLLYKKFSPSHEDLISPWTDFLFQTWGDAEI